MSKFYEHLEVGSFLLPFGRTYRLLQIGWVTFLLNDSSSKYNRITKADYFQILPDQLPFTKELNNMLSNEVIARKVAQIYYALSLNAYIPSYSNTAIFKRFVAVLKFISEAFDINLSSVSKRSGHHSSTKLTEDSAGKFSGTP